MGWIPDDWNIVAGWLLGFVVANCALGVWFRRRGRADRATIRRYMAEGIGPVAAAEQVEREYYTARVAVCALVGDGVVEVSEEGVLTAVPGLRNRPVPRCARSPAASGTAVPMERSCTSCGGNRTSRPTGPHSPRRRRVCAGSRSAAGSSP